MVVRRSATACHRSVWTVLLKFRAMCQCLAEACAFIALEIYTLTSCWDHPSERKSHVGAHVKRGWIPRESLLQNSADISSGLSSSSLAYKGTFLKPEKQPGSNLGRENQTELQNATYKSTSNKVHDNDKVKKLTKICIDQLVLLCIIWDESFPI